MPPQGGGGEAALTCPPYSHTIDAHNKSRSKKGANDLLAGLAGPCCCCCATAACNSIAVASGVIATQQKQAASKADSNTCCPVYEPQPSRPAYGSLYVTIQNLRHACNCSCGERAADEVQDPTSHMLMHPIQCTIALQLAHCLLQTTAPKPAQQH